ncbi:type 12 methyltransferase [Hyphomonas adhaerens MHS-3]|uniref:Type 12 methyltransferase n=1 Tax=Hyphomonas adhaerens MHS-3 TaxID=1280949 RepID=A0A069E8H4_9PROT|nr:class I SAM-dependent methyltransferase [Hyphomonas adhaerens]KCZ84201.1 type 12 methyltransferase [Hyphomonas adhaerens MHS-3]
MQADENPFLKSFKDPAAISNYQSGPPRFTPGFADLHRMVTILLAERVPDDGRILVLGAGGGLELRAMAESQPDWTFVGVDPALPMLELARDTLGDAAARVDFIEGYIDAAPEEVFDGAVCLLTLHFLDRQERLRTIKEIHKRLKPGAPFVAAHSSFPQAPDVRDKWLSRYEAFAVASGVDPEMAGQARDAVSRSVELLTPEQDEQILKSAGFSNVEQFYRAFTWCGWVASA